MHKTRHAACVVNHAIDEWRRRLSAVSTLKADILNITYDCYSQNMGGFRGDKGAIPLPQDAKSYQYHCNQLANVITMH